MAVLAVPVTGFAAEGHWAQARLEKWRGFGIIEGDESGALLPDNDITRAEAAAILSRLLSARDYGATKSFSDVGAGDWFAQVVANVVAEGVFEGISDTEFGPSAQLTREQAATALHRAFGALLAGSPAKTDFTDYGSVSAWAEAGVAALAGYGAISGYPDGSFAPPAPITRAEFVTMLDGIVPNIINDEAAPAGAYEGNVLVLAPNVDLSRSAISGNLLLARGALQSPPVVGAGFEGRIVELMPAAQPSSDGAAYAADGADGDSETSPSPTPAPSPTPLPVQGSGTVITPPSGQTDTETGTPAAAASFAGQATAMGTNYALASVQGDAGSIEFTLDGAPAAATAVLADGSLLKVELPAGSAGGMLNATLDGAVLMAQNLSFGGASAAAPKTLYGTAPMAFSEFFHDITAGIDTVRPDVTAFDAGGAAAAPALFITQGTRAGDLPYAQGDLLAKVDAVSSATYGDTVHYVPTGNLDVTNPGDARFSHGDGNAITGITRVEVGVPFDLYANAELLAAAGRETERSAAVLAACGKVTANSAELADGSFADAGGAAIDAPLVYKPKYLLPDGGWGKRAEEALNGGAVVAKPLPGDGSSDMEDVAYGGNWGDKVTGVSFGTLQAEYAGANYWDNFAEYLYAGYIEDSAGHKEPLVFLQNIFSHRMHEDFDIAISPSRFSRLGRLDAPGTYTAHVYAWGFEDVTAAFEVKGYANAGAAIVGGATVAAAAGGEAQTLTITGVDGIDGYDPAALRLYKGSDEVAGAKYSAAKEGGEVKLTLGTALFDGAFQGAYTIRLVPDTDGVVSKALTFTAVKLIERPLLTAASDLSGGAGATEDAPLAVAKSAGRLYFTDSEFAAALVTSGRSGYTSIQAAGGASPAAAIGSAAAREAAGEPYWLDLAADAFAIGETYIIVANATGFQPQTYYVTVLGEEEDAPPPELPGDAEG